MDIEQDILRKFQGNHGRMTHHELVNEFKDYFVKDEQFKAEFKKIVNKLATVKIENNQKYLVLKSKFHSSKKSLHDGLKSSILEALRGDTDNTAAGNNTSISSEFEAVLANLNFSSVETKTVEDNAVTNVSLKSPLPEITITDSEIIETDKTEVSPEDIDININHDSVISVSTAETNVITCKPEDNPQISLGPALPKNQASAASHRINPLRQSRKDLSMSSPESCSIASISLTEDEKAWLVASVSSDYSSILHLLSKNADLVNCVDFVCGYNVLHYAAKNGNLQLVKLLLTSYKVDVDRRTHGGYTALHFASMHGHNDIVEAMIKNYGASQTIRDNSGRKFNQYANNACGTKVSTLKAYRKATVRPNNVAALGGPEVAFSLYPVYMNNEKDTDGKPPKQNPITAVAASNGDSQRQPMKSCHSLPGALNTIALYCRNRQGRSRSLRMNRRQYSLSRERKALSANADDAPVELTAKYRETKSCLIQSDA